MRFTEIPTNLTKYRIIAAIYRILIGSPEYLQKLSFPVTGSSKFMRGEGSGQSRRGRGVSEAACSLREDGYTADASATCSSRHVNSNRTLRQLQLAGGTKR